jgi:hypothetical protein
MAAPTGTGTAMWTAEGMGVGHMSLGLEFDGELEVAYRWHRCMRQCLMDRVRVALRLLFAVGMVLSPGARNCAVPVFIQTISILVDAMVTLSLQPTSELAVRVRPIVMSSCKLVEALPAYWLSTCPVGDLTSFGGVMRSVTVRGPALGGDHRLEGELQ